MEETPPPEEVPEQEPPQEPQPDPTPESTPGPDPAQDTPAQPQPETQEDFGTWGDSQARHAESDREFNQFGVDHEGPARYARNHGDGSLNAGGNISAGRDITQIYQSGARAAVQSGALAVTWVSDVVASHVRSSSYEQVKTVARTHSVVMIIGVEGTGRYELACCVAAELTSVEKVRSIDMEPGASLSAIPTTNDVLRKGQAHVVELTGSYPVTRQVLATLGGQVAERDCYLIVVGPPSSTVDPKLYPYAVLHECPAAEPVLRRIARVRVQEIPAIDPDSFETGYLSDPEIVAYLATGPKPSDLADLARRLVDVWSRGGRPAEAVTLLYGRLRERAKSILGELKDLRPSQARQALRTLAFRLAYATFSDSPLNIVFDAARELYAALSMATRPNSQPPATELFDGKLSDLLGTEMVVDETPEQDHRPRLIDPRLTNAMLDVLWNNYDQYREPLLLWTFVLGKHHSDAVRRRAASVGGQFSRWGVDDVYRGLIRPWATAPAWRTRHSAAYLMANIVVDPALTPWVRRQISDWSGARSERLNDTAARTYAEIRDIPFTEDVLANLTLIGAVPALTGSFAVPKAVMALAEQQPGGLAEIVAVLGEWARQPSRGLQVQAARALLFLADLRSTDQSDRWPSLLALANKDSDAWDELKSLWRLAFSEATTSLNAFAEMFEWILSADDGADLEDVTVRFWNEALSEPEPVRRRARFNLRRLRKSHPDVRSLHRILPEEKD